MKKVMVGLLAMSILAGCSTETTKETPKKAPTSEAPKPATPVVSQEEQDLTAMVAYGDQMKPIAEDITKILNAINQMANIGSTTPAIMLTDEYRTTADKISDAITSVTGRIRAVNTQGNAKVEEAQSYMIFVADDLDYVAAHYPLAIRNMDSEEINVISGRIQNVGRNARLSTSVISDVMAAVN